MLADLLAKRMLLSSLFPHTTFTPLTYEIDGMEKVVCVASAKVPIVKIWDPELELNCDMNVNNTLALENTRMIKTYVHIDDRVRPLAMIIKYWTRRRILNDAGKLMDPLSILHG
jgi:DNA polymerase sigma